MQDDSVPPEEQDYLLPTSQSNNEGKAGTCGRFKDWMIQFCSAKKTLIPEDEEEPDDLLDPDERAERLRRTSSWIKTACLLIIAVVAAGAGLIYLQFVLVPLVLARFCVYLFQPFINYLVGKKYVGHKKHHLRLRLPRVIAVFIVLVCVIVILIAFGIALYFSVQDIIANYDEYVNRFHELYEEIIDFLVEQGFSQEQIESFLPRINVGDIVPILIGTVTALVPQAILFVMFLLYMLLEYDEKAERDEIQHIIDVKIRRYILLKIAVSLLTAFLVGIVLAAFQVPLWMLFTVLTFLLNFIPNVGSMIAVVIPMPVVLLDPDQTWWSITLVFVLPMCIQFCVGNFVEPNLMGKSMKMSAVAVLVSLAFWGGVWGIVGAFMSLPLTVITHVWLKSIDHPMTQFLGELIAGRFNIEEIDPPMKDKAV